MYTKQDALEILRETSRTFYLPISQLPYGLLEAVASAYLCMRAIDEIEDHPKLDIPTKVKLLQIVSLSLQAKTNVVTAEEISVKLKKYEQQLPEVTIRIGEWAVLAPKTIAPRIWDATAAMADRMAYWANCSWQINTEADLNCYTFSVAGSVGLLLSDLWAWYDGTQANREHAVGFGRGLQTVNILVNRNQDIQRGVDFFPDGWTQEDVKKYAYYHLTLADAYTNALPKGPALDFCKIPLALASATLDVLALGETKLSRNAVLSIVNELNSKG